MKKEKHFLDTSVLRPLLAGTKAYKKYFEEQFKDGRRYTSQYVLMEFKRSYIRNILNFYFVLNMPSIETAGDAITFWSNRYKSSELKAVLQLVGNIIDTHRLNTEEPRHKQKIMQVIAQYAKRLEIKSRRLFADIGKNETHCHRAKIPMRQHVGTGVELIDSLCKGTKERLNWLSHIMKTFQIKTAKRM